MKKTSPWFRVRVSAWPEIAEQIAGVWSESAVITDLAWWEDQVAVGKVERVPGRPTLRRRWGWTDHQVRSMLRDEGAWKMREEITIRQPTASQSPAERQPELEATPDIDEEPPARRQPVASETPQRVGDRAQSTEHREDTYTSGKPAGVSESVEAEQGGTVHQLRLAPEVTPVIPEKPMTPIQIFNEVLDVYTEAATRRCEATGDRAPRSPRLRPGVGRGVALAARIKDHGPEAVKLVVRWWQLSGDDRACLLRGEHPGKGPYSWDTVCRPGNFETYLEMAERWEDSGEGARVGNSDADLDRSARDAWAFLRRCIEDRAFYRREIPDPRASTWPHGIKATLSRLGTTINDLSRSTLYELDRLEAKFIQAHAQINRGTA